MKPTRRELIVGTAAVGVIGCRGSLEGSDSGATAELEPAPVRAPEPAPWSPTASVDLDAFGTGVAAGDVDASTALVHLRSDETGLSFVLVRGVDDTWEEVDRRADLDPDDGLFAISLTGLEPDTVYSYVFETADGRRSQVGRFRTALAPDGQRQVVFGATSCLGSGDPTFAALGPAAEQGLDFMLLTGDAIYADGSKSLETYRELWRTATSTDTFRALLASTSVWATWDDHEVDNNWRLGESDDALQKTVTEEQLAAATLSYTEALPQHPGPNGGMWRQFTWGTVLDVFMLDCRGERNYDDEIISPEQLDWVTSGLRQSTATFKIVISSVHFTDHMAWMDIVEQEDRWQGYPEQRTALLEAIEAAGNTLMISGDQHYGVVQHPGRAGDLGDDQWEVAAGPGGSAVFAAKALMEFAEADMSQYPVMVEEYSCCRFTADPGTLTIRVEFIGSAGQLLADHTIDFS